MAQVKIIVGLATDANGFSIGSLTVSETIKEALVQPYKDSLTKEKRELECFQMFFKTEDIKGNEKEFISYIFSANVNPNPLDTKRVGSKNIKIYNKFTTVLLRLNIISKEEIEKSVKDANVLNAEDITAEFLAIKDMPIRFKTHKNKNGYIEPDLSSLEVIET